MINTGREGLGHNIAAAAAAKSLQSCLTLCDRIDCSPPGSPVHGILPGKSTGVGCHCLLQGHNINSINYFEYSKQLLRDLQMRLK